MHSFDWIEKLSDKKIIIWGASIGGNQAYECLMKNDLQVVAYCDNDVKKQKDLYNGKKVMSPNELRKTINAAEKDYAVIIASFAFEKIYDQIKSQGIICEVYIYLLYDPCHLKSGNIVYSDDEKKEILEMYDAEQYTDNLLKLILDRGFLNQNGFDKIENYTGFGGIDEYYYDDIAGKVFWGGEGTLLDVGSYIGDSVIQIKNVFQNKIKKIYAFEPSQDNWIKILEKNIDNLTLYKSGLGSENGYEFFSENGPFFRMSKNKDGVLTQVVTLDSLNIDIESGCILKIDIEGAEMNCLNGAVNFIKTYKPYIAVCVYHKERDILEIPRYLKKLVPEYHFLLRGGMHTVCYAFPQNEAKEKE